MSATPPVNVCITYFVLTVSHTISLRFYVSNL